MKNRETSSRLILIVGQETIGRLKIHSNSVANLQIVRKKGIRFCEHQYYVENDGWIVDKNYGIYDPPASL